MYIVEIKYLRVMNHAFIQASESLPSDLEHVYLQQEKSLNWLQLTGINLMPFLINDLVFHEAQGARKYFDFYERNALLSI